MSTEGPQLQTLTEPNQSENKNIGKGMQKSDSKLSYFLAE